MSVFGLLKLVASLALLFFVIMRFDWGSIGQQLNAAPIAIPLLLAVLAFWLQAVLAGIRTTVIVRLAGAKCTVAGGVRSWLTGLFFGQAFVTFVAGDAIRIWQLTKDGISFRQAALSIVFDRAIGFVVLIIMFIASLPFVLSLIADRLLRDTLLLLAGASSLVVLVFIGLGFLHSGAFDRLLASRWGKWAKKILDVITVSKLLWLDRRSTLLVLLVSWLMHSLNAMAIYAILAYTGSDVSFSQCYYVMQPVMLMTLLPISFAGWGVREGTMVMGFGLLGVAAEVALVASVTFGIALFIASLPGLAIYYLTQREVKAVQFSSR